MREPADTSRSGLIMAELALAILILTMGVLVVFTLFNTGLDANARAIADTNAGLFADEAFNSLRARSSQAAKEGRWQDFWEDFIMPSGTGVIPVACGDADTGVWADGLIIQSGGIFTNAYTNFAMHAGTVTNMVNHVLRYSLDVRLTNSWCAATNRADVILKIWNGEFGPTNDDNSLIYYAEFDNQGDL